MRVLAGPVHFEFGWELMMWQGKLRDYKKKNPTHHLTIGCAYENSVLYDDFADEFMFHDRIHGQTDQNKLNGIVIRYKDAIRKSYDKYIDPSYCMLDTDQTFIDYSENTSKVKDKVNAIIIHPRNTDKCGTGYRNWSKDKWNLLVAKLSEQAYSIYTIGTTQDTYLPVDSWDFRNLYLSQVINAISNSDIVIGPSSGPMHLASLCNANHLVWTDDKVQASIKATNRERYEKIWNPLGANVTIIDKEGWDPSVDTIYNKTMEILNGKK